VVLVAHRLSTIKDADFIYVLHQGRVVEEGTHRQLMARGGRYRSLWRAQTDDAGDVSRSVGAPGCETHGNGKAIAGGVGHA